MQFVKFMTFNVESDFFSLFVHGYKQAESRDTFVVANLPWIAWRRVVSLRHGMTNGSTQQQMCCRMMAREKCAACNKHVRLQKQTENG